MQGEEYSQTKWEKQKEQGEPEQDRKRPPRVGLNTNSLHNWESWIAVSMNVT